MIGRMIGSRPGRTARLVRMDERMGLGLRRAPAQLALLV